MSASTWERALAEAGPDAPRDAWEAARPALEGPLTVGLLADPGADAERAADLLVAAGLQVRALDPADPAAFDAVHALMWVEAPGLALAASARARVEPLAHHLPARRGWFILDQVGLAALADDPLTEAKALSARAARLLGPGWEVGALPEATAWAAAIVEGGPRLREGRGAQVLRALLLDAQAALGAEREEAALAEAALAEAIEAEQIDARARARERAVAEVAAARATATLLGELDRLYFALSARLPAEIERVGDLARAREALPGWLAATAEAWLAPRLDAWRAELRAEAERLGAGVDRLRSVAPADLPPLDDARGWRRRLTGAALLGGGVGLLALGAWLPGLLGVAGALAWPKLSPADTADALLADARAHLERAHAARREAIEGAVEALQRAWSEVELPAAQARAQEAARAHREALDARREALARAVRALDDDLLAAP